MTTIPPAGGLDLERLRLFSQVAELGSLTRVAVANGSLQSAVSRQISALEQQCGGRLFQRTGRGVKLSILGEKMLPRVEQLLADADRLASDMRSSGGVPTGEVRMGMVPTLAQPLVNMLYLRLRERHPGIRLYCIDGSSSSIDEWLSTGKIDIGVPFRYARVPATEHPLARVETYLVGPPGDSLTQHDTVPFRLLDGVAMVLPGLPNGLRMKLEQQSRRQGISLNVTMEVESLTIQKDLAAAGSAHTILSGHAVGREVKVGLLQASRIIEPGLDRTVTLVTSSQHPMSFAAREVAKFIRAIVEELAANGIWQPPTP
ncbi:MAG: LysR family transcriptional regulator [Burkholderiaceae bacterium]